MTYPHSIADRVTSYLPPADILLIKPTIIDIQRRGEQRNTRPGSEFALTLYKDKLIMVPSWHPLNQTPIASNLAVYGTGSMETLSLEPRTGQKTGDNPSGIISAGIVLLEPRMERLFKRALPAREIKLPVSQEVLTQGIVDLMSILGTGVLTEDKDVGLGSIRVTVGPGAGKFGKSAIGQIPVLSVESYFGKPSFPDRPLVVTAGPNQRLEPFQGKHSSHYGNAGFLGEHSKKLGGDEAIFFAPFEAENPESIHFLPLYSDNPVKLEQAMMRLALANGLGAELLAVTKNGEILLPPIGVNRLGGVTAEYIINYLAPGLGLKAQEQLFSLDQIETGEITGLMFAGNAARIAAIESVKLHTNSGRIIRNIHMEIPPAVNEISQVFEQQVRGEIRPSHISLLNSVNLKAGQQARKVLEQNFSTWL